MDGNLRWSKKNNISMNETYRIGVENLLNLSKFAFEESGISHISAFALSTHNLQRSKAVIKLIFNLLDEYLDKFINHSENYNFRIFFIGDFSIFNQNLYNKILTINELKKKHKKTLIIAINYSGKNDLKNAFIQSNINNNQKNMEKYLSTYDFPDPDVLIRSGGYNRLSDFFLYQCSFTEFFFTKKLWPDLKKNYIKKIINEFSNIERKFGK